MARNTCIIYPSIKKAFGNESENLRNKPNLLNAKLCGQFKNSFNSTSFTKSNSKHSDILLQKCWTLFHLAPRFT
uniref:Ovule protein n=1 Tax=Meloidogyne incognita TaxID=6306 RepID=A0A914KVG4_MELIC